VNVLYDLAYVVFDFMNSGPGLLAMLIYSALVAIPVVLLHELGHAIAARRLVGGEVEITVGTAGKLANIRLGEVVMSINAVAHPGRPDGVARFDASRARFLDIILIALAGPAASLVGTIVTALLLSAASPDGVVHDLLWVATALGVVGVLNIVPITFRNRDGTTLRTDGRVVLDVVRVVSRLSNRSRRSC
jgi:hypothetical protein